MYACKLCVIVYGNIKIFLLLILQGEVVFTMEGDRRDPIVLLQQYRLLAGECIGGNFRGRGRRQRSVHVVSGYI